MGQLFQNIFGWLVEILVELKGYDEPPPIAG